VRYTAIGRYKKQRRAEPHQVARRFPSQVSSTVYFLFVKPFPY